MMEVILEDRKSIGWDIQKKSVPSAVNLSEMSANMLTRRGEIVSKYNSMNMANQDTSITSLDSWS